jgi:hypothetical protein
VYLMNALNLRCCGLIEICLDAAVLCSENLPIERLRRSLLLACESRCVALLNRRRLLFRRVQMRLECLEQLVDLRTLLNHFHSFKELQLFVEARILVLLCFRGNHGERIQANYTLQSLRILWIRSKVVINGKAS